jgi:hypothetical protein
MLSLFNRVLHRIDDGMARCANRIRIGTVAYGDFGRDQFAFSLSIRRLSLMQ